MKVKVVMELPTSCEKCAFFVPSKEGTTCYFPGSEHKVTASSNQLPISCPLHECEQVVEEDRPEKTSLSKLPVGSVFKVGGLYMQKISDDYIAGKSTLNFGRPNAINLANGHRCTMISSLFVQPMSICDVPKMGTEMRFSDLGIGDVFRRETVCGIKISNHDVYAVQEETAKPNYRNIATGFTGTISSGTLVMKLPAAGEVSR